MTDKKKLAVNQAKFCNELSKRIVEDLENSELHYDKYIGNYTAIQNDIVRLRRELSKLSKFINRN